MLTRRPEYALTVRMSEEARRHSEGTGLNALLRERFPSEPPQIFEYRLKNLRPITQTYFDKAANTLAKITRARDLIVRFSEPAFERYLRRDYPDGSDFLAQLFGPLLRVTLTEPNGLFVVAPQDFILGAPPLVYYFRPEDIFQFFPQRYALVRLPPVSGERFLEITPEYMRLYQYSDEKSGVPHITEIFRAVNPVFPAVVCGGEPYRLQFPGVYRSFFSGAFPFWDEALVQFSEKQAGIKQHLFPEKWTYAFVECKTCAGMGKVRHAGTLADCNACNGTGVPPATGAFSLLTVPLPKNGVPVVPTPPAGYVQKDFSAITFLNQDIYTNLYRGLAALNFEFLAETPLNTSGVSKAYDRQELNGFLYKIARHVLQTQFLPLCKAFAAFLFPQSPPERLIPTFQIPERFDLIDASDYETEMTALKNADAPPALRRAVEREYIERRFSGNPNEKARLSALLDLQPLPAASFDTLITMYEKGFIAYDEFYIAFHLEELIDRAAETNPNFYQIPVSEQKSYLKTLIPPRN